MAKMKQLEINTNDTESPTGKSMRIGTGNTYIEIYDEVKRTHTHLIKLIFSVTEMEYVMFVLNELNITSFRGDLSRYGFSEECQFGGGSGIFPRRGDCANSQKCYYFSIFVLKTA